MTTERTTVLGGDEPKANAQKHPTPARDEGERTLSRSAKEARALNAAYEQGRADGQKALSPAQTGGTAVAWRDMADEPYALTLLYTTAPDSDGMERVFLALAHSPETAEAVGWQYLPGDRLAAPVAEGAREAVDHLRECVKLVPAPGAIEAAERFLQALDTGTNRGGVGD